MGLFANPIQGLGLKLYQQTAGALFINIGVNFLRWKKAEGPGLTRGRGPLIYLGIASFYDVAEISAGMHMPPQRQASWVDRFPQLEVQEVTAVCNLTRGVGTITNVEYRSSFSQHSPTRLHV